MIFPRPVLSLDIEATGLNPSADRILELGIHRINPDGTTKDWSQRFNPGMPIPPESTAIHGITDADVADAPPFGQFARIIHTGLQGCDLLGYNLRGLDLPLLWQEFYRVGIKWDWRQHNIIDAGMIFRRNEERTLAAAVQFYCGRKHEDAHGALPDAKATAEVLLAQIQRYPHLTGIGALVDQSVYEGEKRLDLAGKVLLDDKGDARWNFGKAKGTRVIENRGLLEWMRTRDFPAETIHAVDEYLRTEVDRDYGGFKRTD